MNPWLAAALVVLYSWTFWFAFRKGQAAGRKDAIAHYKERLHVSRRDASHFEQILGMDEVRPVLRSAVMRPTASRRSQVEVDDESA